MEMSSRRAREHVTSHRARWSFLLAILGAVGPMLMSGCAAHTTPAPSPAASASAAAAPARTLSAAASGAGATVLIIGDSFTEGYGASDPQATWARIAAETLKWNATIDGVGGTGFTKSSATDGRTDLDFVQRIEAHAADRADYDLVVLQGGLNDVLASPETEAGNVNSAVRTAKLAWPKSDVIVFGPIAPVSFVAYRANVGAIRDAALGAGAFYVDPDRPFPWINSGNSARFDFGDGLHLNDAGYAFLAGRFVAVVDELRP